MDIFQFADSVVNEVPSSVRRIATSYAVISEHPLEGTTQLMVTLTFVLTAVAGADGKLGIGAALMGTLDESATKPKRLLANVCVRKHKLHPNPVINQLTPFLVLTMNRLFPLHLWT